MHLDRSAKRMIHSTIGAIHLTAALVATATGTLVLLMAKGGTSHQRIGYLYLASMTVLNSTAYLVYHLSGRFGLFHVLAGVSLLGLAGGMLPVFFRHRIRLWRHWHYYFMSWSVVGLYAAFWSEVLTRVLPMQQFWPVVAGATGLTTALGSYLIRRHASGLLVGE